MKKQTFTQKKWNFKRALMLIIGGSWLALSGCEKKAITTASATQDQSPSVQEQTLFGTWVLKKKDTYEISGTDSSGQYICNLVGSANYDDSCKVEFGREVNGLQYKARGTMAGCGAGEFSWEAETKGKLLASGATYDIVSLLKDSASFSLIYTNGVLKLKEVVFYKRDK